MLVPTVPKFHQVMWPVIKALRLLGGSAALDELLAKVVEVMDVPVEIQNIAHGDGRQTKLDYNMRWAISYLKKTGYLDNSARGVWTLTQAGEACNADDVARVPAIVRRKLNEERRPETVLVPVSDEASQDLLSEPEQDWKDELLEQLKGISPDAFERLAQRMLREAGFVKVEVTGRSGDGGIDGIGVLRLNLLSFQVLFQCKRYSGSVGPGVIRDFRGAMVGRSDKGLIITTGTFTAEAKREATRDGAPPIELIDGDDLCDLLKSFRIGVRTEMVERVIVERSWFSTI